jgi:hypothetical protein
MSACLFGFTSAGMQSQVGSSFGYAGALAYSESRTDSTVARGPAAHTNNLSGNMTFVRRWSESFVPLPSGAASNTSSLDSSLDSSSALGYASAPTTTSVLQGPTGLPAKSGISYTLSPYAGYINPGSAAGSLTVGDTSGSIAFPVGHSFGLMADYTAAPVGGYGFYQGGTNLYRRDPDFDLIGRGAHIGHFGDLGGANFASSGAAFEGYIGCFTPFAIAGALGAQGLVTRRYGTIGTAYYPTDNLQFADLTDFSDLRDRDHCIGM